MHFSNSKSILVIVGHLRHLKSYSMCHK
uniref:Uncharacterized protein n=1 Tax=Arundo donax TaxID=35708 RepID=A0A0A9FS63_ARUDO